MADFKIGADVYCADGRCGRLIKVVLDPHTKRVTHLIVEKGFLQKKDRVIPVDAVERVEEDRIWLKVRSDELSQFPEYREEEFEVPAPDFKPDIDYTRAQILIWASLYGSPIEMVQPMIRQRVKIGVDPDQPVIGRGTKVYAIDGPVGEIDHVLVDKRTGEITHIIVRKGILPRHVVVPFHLVSSVLDDGVYLKVTKKELEQMRHYIPRADEDIQAEVRDKLAQATEHDLSKVQAEVRDGVVYLSGQVKDVESKWYAERLARSVRGVIDVENALTTDTEVVARVTAALLEDPRTSRYPIEVVSEHGIVTLSGVVPSEEVKRAAEEIARRQKGVITVINALEVRPEDFEYWTPPFVPAPHP
ncbi:MAG: BON domain-containing protein [Chloroflexi bacterium]|nr:BON domain-containing protein [Chloroflexota bacterium]